MCFTNKKKKLKKYNKIHPYPKKINNSKIINKPNVTKISTNEFLKEFIICHNCNKSFNIGTNQIKIHCAGCNNFFHCGIAGKCKGKNCNLETTLGNKHRLSWCINCVPNILENKEKLNGIGECICNECINN